MDPVSRTSRVVSTPGFVADHESTDYVPGRQIDWANLDAAWNGHVPAGTILEASTVNAGKVLPRANGTGPAIGVLASNADSDSRVDALTGYGMIVGGVLYGNLMPENANANFATWQGELNTNGTGFVFTTYSDNRGA